MLDELKRLICEANLKLVAEGLVFRTFGNVSGIDRESGHVVIKPSGIGYDSLKPEQMVVVSLETGERVEGSLRCSSDTPTHLELYRAFGEIGGVSHTHSPCATAWAQGRRDLIPLGTTHADYFHGPVPCTRCPSPPEVKGDYEASIGKIIVERFVQMNVMEIPGVLVADHGPFTWGSSPDDAVQNAVILEHLAELAIRTISIEPRCEPLARELLDKHYYRKHGPDAYYGQE